MSPKITGIFRKRKGLIAIGGGLVLIVLLTLVPSGRGNKTVTAPRETAVVVRGELTLSIQSRGQFQADKSVSIFPETQRRATITWLVLEGTVVRKGDVLAKFDTNDCENRISQDSMRLESSRNGVIQAEEARKMTEASNATSLANAETTLRMAQLAYDQYGDVLLTPDGRLDEAAYDRHGAPARGDAYQDFRDAELKILRARTDLERARTDFKGMDKLVDKGFVSNSDYLNAKLAVDEAARALESARLDYQILRSYTYPQTKARNAHGLKDAEGDLESARIRASVKMTQAETSLRSARLEFDNRKEQVDEDRAELAKRTITSPIDGQVLYGDPSMPPHWREGYIGVGKPAYKGMRLFTIPDLSLITVQLRLLEMDYFTAPVGQEVQVTTEVIPGLVFKGKLTKVADYASEGDNWHGGGSAKAFDATVTLDSTDPRIKPGMSCDIEIVQARVPDVLYVPLSAVSRKGDRDTCTVVEGTAERVVVVQAGRMSDKYVEIKSGLTEGQKVLVTQTAPASAAPRETGRQRGAGRAS